MLKRKSSRPLDELPEHVKHYEINFMSMTGIEIKDPTRRITLVNGVDPYNDEKEPVKKKKHERRRLE